MFPAMVRESGFCFAPLERGASLDFARSINIPALTGRRNLVQPPLLMDSCQKGIE